MQQHAIMCGGKYYTSFIVFFLTVKSENISKIGAESHFTNLLLCVGGPLLETRVDGASRWLLVDNSGKKSLSVEKRIKVGCR